MNIDIEELRSAVQSYANASVSTSASGDDVCRVKELSALRDKTAALFELLLSEFERR